MFERKTGQQRVSGDFKLIQRVSGDVITHIVCECTHISVFSVFLYTGKNVHYVLNHYFFSIWHVVQARKVSVEVWLVLLVPLLHSLPRGATLLPYYFLWLGVDRAFCSILHMIHNLRGDGHRQFRQSHLVLVDQLLFMRSGMHCPGLVFTSWGSVYFHMIGSFRVASTTCPSSAFQRPALKVRPLLCIYLVNVKCMLMYYKVTCLLHPSSFWAFS